MTWLGSDGKMHEQDEDENQEYIVKQPLTEDEYEQVCSASEYGVQFEPDFDLSENGIYDPTDKENFTVRDENYSSLESVLNEAYAQAAFGKGKERHAINEPFEQQLIVYLEKLGLSYCEGQSVKKIIEAHRTGSEEDLLGAINYIAAHIIAKREST
jgi:hypothetical protein